MTLVISIQSQVVHGHVGNSAAVYPMQAAGVCVAAVPTTLLSNHPHYRTMRGTILDADLVADLLQGVKERGLVERATILLTGYLGSPEIAERVADFAERALHANPRLRYVCDPVMGDDDLGMFAATGMPDMFRDRLIPLASIITPNQFELELLTKRTARNRADLLDASSVIAACGCPTVIATGCTLSDTPTDAVETILCQAGTLARIATPRLPIRPCGTGDLLTGLTTAQLANGLPLEAAMRRAVARVYAILERTMAGRPEEMAIIETYHERRLQ